MDRKHRDSNDRAQAAPTRGERIAKAMARAGLCSRREAEAWIAAGRVAVNGSAIASPALNVGPRDTVTVDGKALPTRERTRLFLYHKPRGLVTTHVDPQGRPTIFGGLPTNLPRLVSVGRLDLSTEGLLLLTNDGGLARALELPQTGWLRRYRVRAHGRVAQPGLDALRSGIEIDGIRYGPIEASIDRQQGANVWLTFAIREGKNREVRNVLRELGLDVNRLIRVSFGPFQLGDLPPGGIEEVKTRHLREQLGDRVVASAGADFSAPVVDRPAPPRAPPKVPSKPAPSPKAPPPHKGRGPQQTKDRAGRKKPGPPRRRRSEGEEARGTRREAALSRSKRPRAKAPRDRARGRGPRPAHPRG